MKKLDKKKALVILALSIAVFLLILKLKLLGFQVSILWASFLLLATDGIFIIVDCCLSMPERKIKPLNILSGILMSVIFLLGTLVVMRI